MENIRNMITYANGHHNTQLNSLLASEAGVGVLKYMQKKLRFAGDELLRMENEGGVILNERQNIRVNNYFILIRRIKKTLMTTTKTVQAT